MDCTTRPNSSVDNGRRNLLPRSASTAARMRALVFDRAGDAGAVLRLGEAPEPVLQPNGVLIEVRARVVQPADFLFLRGVYRVLPVFPQVAGIAGPAVFLQVGPAGGCLDGGP